MELSNGIDIFSTAIIIASILLSYTRGFMRECFTIIAWIISAISSIKLGPALVPIMTDLPFLEEFFLGNCPLTMLVSFVLTFVITLTICSLLVPLFSPKFSLEKEPSLWITLDRMGGLLFGFARSLIILIFLLICFQDVVPRLYLPTTMNEALEASLLNNLLGPSKIFVKQEIYSNASTWLKEPYELILRNECEITN